MTWDEVQGGSDDIAKRLAGSGWLSRKVHQSLAPADLLDKGATKWALAGEWQQCDGPHVVATLTVEHYNSQSAAAFTPPAALSDPLPDDAADRFLLKLYIAAQRPVRG